MKRLLLIFAVCLTTLSAIAGARVTIDGIEFDYTYTLHLESSGTSRLKAEVIVVNGKSKKGEVEIPSSIVVDDGLKLYVTKIGQYAFDGNKDITKVTIPGCIMIIDGGAFRDCSSLETVDIEPQTGYSHVFLGQDFEFHGLTYIHDGAFSGCTKLKNINLPETVTYIGDTVFSDCTSLASINLPSSLTTLGSLMGPFSGCTALKSITIPAKVKGLCYRAFLRCTSLETVTFLGAIDAIGEEAFWQCPSLTSIDLSKGVRRIDDKAFQSCTSLRRIIFPETGLTSIGSSCFALTALKSINIPASVTYLGEGFCNSCTELTEAVIQGGVYSSTAGSQFINCTNLKKATITWTGQLPGKMFQGCSSLENVNLNNGITAIGGNAFNGCTSLEALTLPSTVTSIKGEAFLNCTALGSISIPGSVTEIGSSAFKGCTSFVNFTIPSGVSQLSTYLFDGCSNLESVSLPSGITSINEGAFRNCLMLRTLDLPAGLQTVAFRAFQGCSSLLSLTFPASMTSLANEAFSGCSNMELIDLRLSTQLGITSTERTGVFSGVPETTVILLPGMAPPEGDKEPYAVLSNDNKTLTFYYDDKKKAKNGMNVGPFNDIDYGWYNNRENITEVIFDESFANCTTITSTAFWFFECKNLAKITGLQNLNTENVTNMFGMFEDCQQLTNIDLSHFNTSNVTNMNEMFYNCIGLTSLNVSNFDTKNVTNMSYMFCDVGVSSLDLSNFNTENVTNMSFMFASSESLTKVDVSSFNTGKVTNMDSMFGWCKALKELDLSNFNTEKVENMSTMFYACNALTTIYCNDAWSCGTSDYMFGNCNLLVGAISYDSSKIDVTYANPTTGYFTKKGTAIVDTPEPYAVLSNDNKTLTFYYDDKKEANGGMDVGPFTVIDEKVNSGWYDNRENITTVIFDSSFANCTSITSTSYWFFGCSNLTQIKDIHYLNTSNVTYMWEMFAGCSALKTIDVSKFNTSNVTNMGYMFYGCNALTDVDVRNFETGNVTDMRSMFDGCNALTSLDVSNFNTEKVKNMSFMFWGCSSLTNLDVSHFNTSKVTDMDNMFNWCSALTNLDVSNFNTSNVTNMRSLFGSCETLKKIDVSKFNTQNVTNMWSMFAGCYALEEVDVSNFNTSNVVYMNTMFASCKALTNLDLSIFDTGNVTNMGGMFQDCIALKSIDVSNFNTSNTTILTSMFCDCYALTSIDVGNFNTSNVKSMELMFSDCKALTSLDLSYFNTSNVERMTAMFLNCSALTTIYVGEDWSTSNVKNSTDMFFNCKNLVGEKGTVYDAAHIDYTYAHVDGGESNPGYFTFKSSRDVTIDDTNFPNIGIRHWLLSQDFGSDGVISNEEIAILTSMDLSGLGINDLTGIEYFTSLTELNISNNQIKGEAMDNLIASLPTASSQISARTRNDSAPYILYVLDTTTGSEGNEMTEAQVIKALAKGWQPYYYNGTEWMTYAGGNLSGIQNVVDDNNRTTPAFNLYGQKLSVPNKGINIINGHKVLVK